MMQNGTLDPLMLDLLESNRFNRPKGRDGSAG
jgi:hypothetical protein